MDDICDKTKWVGQPKDQNKYNIQVYLVLMTDKMPTIMVAPKTSLTHASYTLLP